MASPAHTQQGSTWSLQPVLALLIEDSARAARRYRVQAEKARHLAQIAARRSGQAGTKRLLFLAEAQRLRVEARRCEAEAGRHEETTGALQQMARQDRT